MQRLLESMCSCQRVEIVVERIFEFDYIAGGRDDLKQNFAVFDQFCV